MNSKQSRIAKKIRTKNQKNNKHGTSSELEIEYTDKESGNQEEIPEPTVQRNLTAEEIKNQYITTNITKALTRSEVDMFNMAFNGNPEYKNKQSTHMRAGVKKAADKAYNDFLQKKAEEAEKKTESPKKGATKSLMQTIVGGVKKLLPKKNDKNSNSQIDASKAQEVELGENEKSKLQKSLAKVNFSGKEQMVDYLKTHNFNDETKLKIINDEIDFIIKNITDEDPMREKMLERLAQLFDEQDKYTNKEFKEAVEKSRLEFSKTETSRKETRTSSETSPTQTDAPTDEPLNISELEKTSKKSKLQEPLTFAEIPADKLGEFQQNLEDRSRYWRNPDNSLSDRANENKVKTDLKNAFTIFSNEELKNPELLKIYNERFASDFGLKIVTRKTGMYIGKNNKVAGINFKRLDPKTNDDQHKINDQVVVPKQKNQKSINSQPYNILSSKKGGKYVFSYDINDVYRIIENDLAINLSKQAKMQIDSIVAHAVKDVQNKSHGDERIDATVGHIEDYINERSKSGEAFAFTGQWREKLIAVLEREFIGIRATDEQIKKEKKKRRISRKMKNFQRLMELNPNLNNMLNNIRT